MHGGTLFTAATLLACTAACSGPQAYYGHDITAGSYEFLTHHDQDGSVCYALVQKPSSAQFRRDGNERTCTDAPAPAITMYSPITDGSSLILAGVVGSHIRKVVITNGRSRAVNPTAQAFVVAVPKGRYTISALDGGGNVVGSIDSSSLPSAPAPTPVGR